jgi:muramoyltetrapeptide carboxypeptidase
MSKFLKPARLSPGDTVGIVAPASPPPNPAAVDHAIAAVEKLGFQPKPGRHLRLRQGFLAGGDRERAADLMAMFADKKVRAILCLRGGYGSARIVDRLDYGVIRRHPKILCGYSDITSLHFALLTKCRLIGFHAPLLAGEFSNPACPDFTRDAFLRTVTRAAAPGNICDGYPGDSVTVLRGGTAEGPLVGGNLSVICATVGTSFMPSFKDAIFFFEEIGECPYRIDRMLTHLLNAGILRQVAGIAVGINKNCHDPRAASAGEFRQSTEDVLRERLRPLGVPVVIGLPFGHVDFNATRPLGVRAKLDGRRKDLVITESAVR